MSEVLTVAEARRLKNITQEEAANHLGVTMNTYRNKELGITKFYVDEAYSLCNLFGMTMDQIFFGKTVAKK